MGLLLSLFDEVDGSWEGVGPGPGGGGVRLGWAEDEDEDEREDEDGLLSKLGGGATVTARALTMNQHPTPVPRRQARYLVYYLVVVGW